jgi:hypothetical protein
MITDASNMWLRLYRHYQSNKLPFSGGILDQPNGYLLAMETIESVINDV